MWLGGRHKRTHYPPFTEESIADIHVLFDADALDAAYEELDARYDVGEAAPYARTFAILRRFERAMAAQDWAEVTRIFLLSPNFCARRANFLTHHLTSVRPEPVEGQREASRKWSRSESTLCRRACRGALLGGGGLSNDSIRRRRRPLPALEGAVEGAGFGEAEARSFAGRTPGGS